MEFLEPSKNQSFICIYIYIKSTRQKKQTGIRPPPFPCHVPSKPEKNCLGFQAGRQGVATFHGT